MEPDKVELVASTPTSQVARRAKFRNFSAAKTCGEPRPRRVFQRGMATTIQSGSCRRDVLASAPESNPVRARNPGPFETATGSRRALNACAVVKRPLALPLLATEAKHGHWEFRRGDGGWAGVPPAPDA